MSEHNVADFWGWRLLGKGYRPYVDGYDGRAPYPATGERPLRGYSGQHAFLFKKQDSETLSKLQQLSGGLFVPKRSVQFAIDHHMMALTVVYSLFDGIYGWVSQLQGHPELKTKYSKGEWALVVPDVQWRRLNDDGSVAGT